MKKHWRYWLLANPRRPGLVHAMGRWPFCRRSDYVGSKAVETRFWPPWSTWSDMIHNPTWPGKTTQTDDSAKNCLGGGWDRFQNGWKSFLLTGNETKRYALISISRVEMAI
jgi:hypothetical protein